MRVIVIGGGKVGQTIIRHLSTEGHDVAVIDTDSSVITDITDNYDVMGVVGNGASYSVQKEAGIEDANLVIAVTDSDELNLLCCLFARKAGGCTTIARVRNPLYSSEIRYIKEELGLSMTINPEYAAALEIARLIRVPSAIKIETFARGRVEMLQVVIPQNSVLDGCSLMNISSKVGVNVLVCAVERGGDVIIPNGQFVLRQGDTISIVADPSRQRHFFTKIGINYHRISNTLIIGGGTIAYYLAKELIAAHIDVKIIERDEHRCEELAELLPEAVVINADATDQDMLMEEGLDSCESFVTLTGIDEENIFLSLFAQQKNPNAKIITKTNKIAIDSIIGRLNLGSMIHPKDITAEYILRYVRAMQNTIGSNVETLYNIVEHKAEALEFNIQADAPVIGIPLSELKTRDDVLIACIFRSGKIIQPNGQSRIQEGDKVIVVTTKKGFGDIKDILA